MALVKQPLDVFKDFVEGIVAHEFLVGLGGVGVDADGDDINAEGEEFFEGGLVDEEVGFEVQAVNVFLFSIGDDGFPIGVEEWITEVAEGEESVGDLSNFVDAGFGVFEGEGFAVEVECVIGGDGAIGLTVGGEFECEVADGGVGLCVDVFDDLFRGEGFE